MLRSLRRSYGYGSVATPCRRRASTPGLSCPSWVGLLALVLAVWSCRTPVEGTTLGLVPTTEIEGDFLWRQRVRWHAGGTSGVTDAVIQKRCEELLVLLLDPLGVPGVEIRQRGAEVEVVERTQRLPVAPLRILRDVHRAYFLPLEVRAQEAGSGVLVSETGPDDVRIENRAMAYVLEITTLSRTSLRCASGPDAGRPGSSRSAPGAVRTMAFLVRRTKGSCDRHG